MLSKPSEVDIANSTRASHRSILKIIIIKILPALSSTHMNDGCLFYLIQTLSYTVLFLYAALRKSHGPCG